MNSALKRLGWVIGVAAGTSLWLALRSRRMTPANSRSVRLPSRLSPVPVRRAGKPQSPVGFAHDTEYVCLPAKSPYLTIDPADPDGDKRLSSAPFEMMDIQLSVPPRMRRRRITGWIWALSLVAIALVCVCSGVALRKQDAAPLGSDLSSISPSEPKEMLDDDQRPIVGLLQTTLQPLTPTGGGFTITLYNSGKSPAFDIRIRDIIRIEELNEEPGTPLIDTAPALDAGTLMPGAEFRTGVGFRTSPATLAALRNGQVRAVNYMLVTYEDQVRRSHTTQQCFYWHLGLQSPVACDRYNREE